MRTAHANGTPGHGAHGCIRRPAGYWSVFQRWWDAYYCKHGQRPKDEALKRCACHTHVTKTSERRQGRVGQASLSETLLPHRAKAHCLHMRSCPAFCAA